MHTASQELAGRQAVLTGAAGGIGSAIARELVSRGAKVYGLDRDHEGLRRLEQQFPGCFVGQEVDLAERSASDRTFDELARNLAGHCDILVNNAGIARVAPFATSDDALLDRLLEVNFAAAFRLTRALLPALRHSGRGVVVNIASELALIGQPGYTAYSATKGAVLAWSRALAIELAADGIRVNAVCPGPIDTTMLAGEFATASDPQQARAEEIATVPLGRLGVPRDVATVVAFLASDVAGFVSGAAWPVDGGKTAR
jgi:NAD(P)-dependent dehydrogenase (short-subunit alcohol dehydrogenase family)